WPGPACSRGPSVYSSTSGPPVLLMTIAFMRASALVDGYRTKERAGRRYSGLLRAVAVVRSRSSVGEELAELESGAERVELVREVLVAAVDQRDAVHCRGALSRERRDEVREARAQVRDLQLGRVQLGRPGDHRRVHEVALAEPAGRAAEAFAVQLHLRAHRDQGAGEAEPLLVHRLVHDGQALSLRQRDHERLLPVGLEAGVHVGLQ